MLGYINNVWLAEDSMKKKQGEKSTENKKGGRIVSSYNITEYTIHTELKANDIINELLSTYGIHGLIW